MRREDMASMSGLELMQALVDGTIPPPSMAETMGLSMVEVREGWSLFHAQADARHLNPLGMVHGGFAATALDSVTGCAVHTRLEPGVGYATIDLDVKMLKAVPREVVLRAEAEVIHLSKRLGVAEGTLRDTEGNLYAHATATCMIFR